MADLNYEAEEIISKCFQIPQRDLLRDVMSYNDSMTISQVVKFFERQGVLFTKSMIQHYVRVGLLPPPEGKRRYTRFHLLMLAVIEQLKGIYALDDISTVFSGVEPEDGLIDQFQSMTEYAVEAWRETLSGLAGKAAETVDSMGMDTHASQRMFEAFVLLGIMAQSAAAKQTAGMLIGWRSE